MNAPAYKFKVNCHLHASLSERLSTFGGFFFLLIMLINSAI